MLDPQNIDASNYCWSRFNRLLIKHIDDSDYFYVYQCNKPLGDLVTKWKQKENLEEIKQLDILMLAKFCQFFLYCIILPTLLLLRERFTRTEF